jgi:hypothetical protein
MKQRSWLRRIRTALLMAPLLSAIAQGEVRVEFPEDDPGPPFYARIRHNFAIQNGQWAAIIFYRSPNCVAPSFNLLRLFNPAAFGCPLTVEGFALYDQVPPPPGVSPKQAKTFGLGAVPVWFFRWADLQTAVADGVLTIQDLAAMNPIVGSATFFRETLHPTETAQVPKLSIVARGTTATGTFFVQASATGEGLELKHVTIELN